jgi:hypothetical protein
MDEDAHHALIADLRSCELRAEDHHANQLERLQRYCDVILSYGQGDVKPLCTTTVHTRQRHHIVRRALAHLGLYLNSLITYERDHDITCDRSFQIL